MKTILSFITNIYLLCFFLGCPLFRCSRLLRCFGYDLHTFFISQFFRLGNRLRYPVIGFLIRNVRAITSIQDLQFRILVKLLQITLFIFFPFLINQFDRFFRGDGKRIQIFRDRDKLAVMTDERSEPAYGCNHIFSFIFTDGTGKIE